MGRLQQQLYELLSEAGAAEKAEAAPADSSAVVPPPLACSAGPLTRISPALQLVGGTALKQPLDAEQRAAIKAAGASRGSGVWLVPAAQLDVTNSRWEGEVVAEAVRRTKAALGISPDASIEARLSRLELYEKGNKFLADAHNSSAGVEGAFGELAILLPSSYQGGELWVLHGGREVQVDLAARNAKSSCFAAFYSGCLVGTQPVTSGHRCLLYYDLVWAGGSRPPQLPRDLTTRLLSISQEWNLSGVAPGAKSFCYLLDNKYSHSTMREQGLDALQGADKKAAQLLLSACERGAELDVCLALVKATGELGVTRREIFDKICANEQPAMCPDCDGFHHVHEQILWEETDAVFRQVLQSNEGYNAHQRIKWTSILAGKLVPLAGPQPPFHHTSLRETQLLCGQEYWLRKPDGVDEAEEYDSDDEETSGGRQQFHRVGLLIWPRSKRLLNTVHGDLAQQTIRLYTKLCPDEKSDEGAGSPTANTVLATRFLPAPVNTLCYGRDRGSYCMWGDDDGFEFPDGVDDDYTTTEQPVATTTELGDAIARYLADVCSKKRARERDSLRVMLHLAPDPQLAGPGNKQNLGRALKLLQAAAARSSFPDFAPQVAALLKLWGWPSSALPALRRWVRCGSRSFRTGIGLLDAVTSDSASAQGRLQRKALAAASTLALGLAKALRQGTLASNQSKMSSAFSSPDTIVLALQRVPTAAGQLALESAVESVLQRYQGAPLWDESDERLELQQLHSACRAILRAVAPGTVAGNATLLKLACSCLAALATIAGDKPELPAEWSKPAAADALAFYISDPVHSTLRAFLLHAEQREITIACNPLLDVWIHTHLLYGNDDIYEDLEAERVEPEQEGGPACWRLTKQHATYERKLDEFLDCCNMRRSLLDLLLPCLVLALPRGGSSSAAAAGDEAPPAKAQRRSS